LGAHHSNVSRAQAWRSPRIGVEQRGILAAAQISGVKDIGVYKSRDLDKGDAVLIEVHLFRNFALTLAWKLLGVMAIDFLLLRVWGPNLVNRHDNLALAGALACCFVAIVATAWLAFQLWIDIGRFITAKRHLATADRLKRDL
jgi:hypothetical protein